MNARDENLYRLSRLGLSMGGVETVLRALPAIQRAHEAECCAWPEATVRAFTKRGDHAFLRVCATIHEEAGPYNVVRQTDPRGACVQVYGAADNVETVEPFLRLGAEGFTASAMKRIERYSNAVRE